MKSARQRPLAVLLAVFTVFWAGDLLACTATTVYERATEYLDTEYYDIVRDVVTTDTQIQAEDWQSPDATHAAVGTIFREALEHTPHTFADYFRHWEYPLEQHLSTPAKARSFLNRPAEVNHPGIQTVRDHAILHGGEWETNPPGGGGPNPPPPPPPPPPPIDHAG